MTPEIAANNAWLFVILMPLVGPVIVFLGLLMRRNADSVARFMRAAGARLYGERAATRIYTERGAHLAGTSGIVFGVLFTALMIGQLVAKIVYSR